MVTYVYRTHKIGECPTIRYNELKLTLHIKFNGKIYYRKVPKITNCS